MLPPPIFEYEVVVLDTETGEHSNFNLLSSGQKQMIYYNHSILYHLINLNSIMSIEYERPHYNNVNVVLEEVELYYHPEMQRKMVKSIVDYIHLANFENIKSIQLIFVTHSPFILSDIPSRNCLMIEENGKLVPEAKKKQIKTFGANIFDILRSGFFLENGLIGEFAEDKIKQIIEMEDAVKATEMAEIIDDPYVKSHVKEMIYQKSQAQTRLEILQKEMDRIKSMKK